MRHSKSQRQELIEAVKKEWRKKLRGVDTIYVVGHTMSKKMWNRFYLYYIKGKKLNMVTPVGTGASKASELFGEEHFDWGRDVLAKEVPFYDGNNPPAFHVTGYGTDRAFEVVYGLSMWLYGDGYKLDHKFLS